MAAARIEKACMERAIIHASYLYKPWCLRSYVKDVCMETSLCGTITSCPRLKWTCELSMYMYDIRNLFRFNATSNACHHAASAA